MENHRTKTYCFYCQDELAEHKRDIPIRRNNGYNLSDFEAQLCKRCNFLDDKTLSDYFSV